MKKKGNATKNNNSKNGNGSVKEHKKTETHLEFGGTYGVIGIMIFSHVIIMYFWICLEYYGGSLVHPTSFTDILPFFGRLYNHLIQGASPTWYTTGIYVGFVFFQALLAAFLPGVKVKGLPIPHEGNKQLEYNCNGVLAWYITLVAAAILHVTGIFRLSEVALNLGPLTTVSIIFGNVLSVYMYAESFIKGTNYRMSGNHLYDFFMGAALNPRIGTFDWKMFAEIRAAWILLFFNTLSAAVLQYEKYGSISSPMLFMVLAHGLYTNACMKGEECIPTTWDIFYEKWGWMIIFWNFAGVPFVYCAQSIYLVKSGWIEHSLPYTLFCFILLIVSYYIWDTANSQKNRFRMMERGTYIPRNTFPQLPWGTLKNAQFLETKCGSRLLIDGWYKYARKIHYAADLGMALSWGLICGFESFIPYFYFLFFITHLIHRAQRDDEKCAKKYGKDWEIYCKKVPYILVPYVF